jgi:uncharacterized protein (DUF433 family)
MIKDMKNSAEPVYIVHDPAVFHGEPIIKGMHTAVRAVVKNWRLMRSPEEIIEIITQLPHLTLVQVHEALSYFSSRRREIEADGRITATRRDPVF